MNHKSRFGLFFLAMAGLNEVVWRTMSTDLWVKIETFGFPIALMAFLMLQFSILQRYMDDPEQK